MPQPYSCLIRPKKAIFDVTMKILITGAAGFIGQLLADALLNDQNGQYHLILTDLVEPPVPANTLWPKNATCLRADLSKETQSVVSADLDAVFIFHGIMSSASEVDFDLGMRKYRPASSLNGLADFNNRLEGQFRHYSSTCRCSTEDMSWCQGHLHF